MDRWIDGWILKKLKVVNRLKICQFTMSITYQPQYEMWPAMRAKNFVKSYTSKFGTTRVYNYLSTIFPEKFDANEMKSLRLNHFENMSLLAYIMADDKSSMLSLYDFETYVNPITFAKKRLLMSKPSEFRSLMGSYYNDMEKELENMKRMERETTIRKPTWAVNISPKSMERAINNLRKSHSNSVFRPIDSPPREDVTQVEESVNNDETGVEDVTQVEESVEDRTERLAIVLEEANALDHADVSGVDEREYDDGEEERDYDSDDSDYEDKIEYARSNYYCGCCYR